MKTIKTNGTIMRPPFKNIINTVLITAALGIMSSAFAQTNWKASVGTQGYFAKLDTESSILSTTSEPGAGIQLGLSYAIHTNWSLNTGLGLSYLETRNSLAAYNDRVDATDFENESFEFRYALTEYSEKQKSTVLSIPLTLQYETSGSQTRFYTKAGANALVFLNSKSTGKANSLTTSGFYERFNGELTAPRFAGFGTFENISFNESDVDLSISINALLEMGVKEKMGGNQWLYFGVFVEYGLNDIRNQNANSLVEYNRVSPTDFINNSAINAIRSQNGEAVVDKATIKMIGFKLNYEFGI